MIAPKNPQHCDLLVIGAGPTGLYATYYAGFRSLEVAVVDANAHLGGQIAALFPEKLIYDVAGFPAVTGSELVEALSDQASSARPSYHLGRCANHLSQTLSGWEVVLDDGTLITCSRILLTVGLGRYHPRPLPAGAGWEGRGLDYRVGAIENYLDKDVVVVGGGDSALDWALHLDPVARSTRLVHHRGDFRAHPGTVERLEASSIEVVLRATVGKLLGGDRLEQVVLVDSDRRVVNVPADRVVAALGMVADLGPLRAWGVEMVGQRILVDHTMQTSRSGIYAAGDVVERPGKVRLITVGFGEAATAVNHLAAELRPHLDVFPGHSTDAKPPKPRVAEESEVA